MTKTAAYNLGTKLAFEDYGFSKEQIEEALSDPSWYQDDPRDSGGAVIGSSLAGLGVGAGTYALLSKLKNIPRWGPVAGSVAAGLGASIPAYHALNE